MKRLITLIFLVTFFGCSSNEDVKLVCECYKTAELFKNPPKLEERECSDSLLGRRLESVRFNEKNNTFSWRGSVHVGYEETRTGYIETKLNFTDNNIYFRKVFMERVRHTEEIEEQKIFTDFDLNRISLLGEERTYSKVMTSVTRYFQCKVTEGV